MALDWEDTTQTLEVDDYTYDPRHPREFYVYPPNTGLGAVRAVVCQFPTELVDYTTDEVNWGAQELPVSDAYAEAIAQFVLHRAFNKEAEWALNPIRAKQHFELYLELVATKGAQDAEFSTKGEE